MRMKFTLSRVRATVIALLSILMFSALPAMAQGTAREGKTITIKYEGKPLNVALDEVERQSGYYRVQYVMDDVAPFTATVSLSSVTTEAAVQALLKGTPLRYNIDGRYIHVYDPQKSIGEGKKETTKTISGRVYDDNGEPLIGVTVKEKGSNTGTVTNLDGEFSLPISASSSSATLQFSYIGKTDVEITANTQRRVNVVMQDDGHVLDDVVVTGYQTLSKERVTGSFDKVGQDILANRPTSDLSSALQGVVAGMQATENEDGSVDFLIRGTSSLYASTSPLIVVDGFPIEGTFSSINPNDVESVTVLKDAAAASIWGARSANGVIVVTTKKGQKGKLKVDVQGFLKINTRQDLDYVLSQADSRTTVDYELKAIENDWALSSFVPSTSRISYPLSKVHDLYYEHMYYGLSDADYAAGLEQLRNTNNRQQVKDNLMQTQVLQQYNVSLSAGSDKYDTYASIMYEKNNEQTIRRGYERFMLNFNNSYHFNKWLTGTLSGTFQRKKQDNTGPTLSDISALKPYDLILNEDGSYTKQAGYWNNLITSQYQFTNLPYSDMSYNILQDIRSRSLKTETTRYRVNLGLNAKIWRGLTFDTKFQYERNEDETRNYYSEENSMVRYYIDYYTDYDLNNDVLNEQYIPSGDIIRSSKSTNYNWVWRNQLSYSETFGKHDITALAGMEMSKYKTSDTTYPWVLGYDPDTNTSTAPYYGSATTPSTIVGSPDYYSFLSTLVKTTFSDRVDKYMSFFGNVGYMYDDKYGASFSIRSDGSNYVTEDKSLRWSPMWSIGGRWNVTSEKFMAGTKSWLDRLTLRATYGINGNAEKSTSTQTLLYTYAGSVTNSVVSRIASYGNPLLRWEETYTTNIGLDYSFLHGMFTGKIDYYHRLGKYIVGEVTVPSVYGTTTQKYNNAEIENNGVELELTGNFKVRPIDLGISSTVTFAYNDNVVKKLYYPDLYCYQLTDGTFVEGKPVGAIYSYDYAGLNEDGVPMVKTNDGETYNMNDLTLSYYVLGKDKIHYSGTTVSPYTFGWANTFSWKGLNLYIYITGKFGGVYRSPNQTSVPLANMKDNISKWITNLINSDGSTTPCLPVKGDYSCYRWDRYMGYMQYDIRSASFLKLKEIDLSYNIPAYLLRRFHLSGLKVFMQAKDLGLLYTANKEGYDPEWLPGKGYRPSTSIMFGINVSL